MSFRHDLFEGQEEIRGSLVHFASRRYTRYTKAKLREDGSMPPVDLAIPVFGYQNHISIDRGFGCIRE
jgi:hypothetical protein